MAVKVTYCPEGDGFIEDITKVEVAVLGMGFTTCVRTGETLPAKSLSPSYTAVIGWLPAERPKVVKVARRSIRVELPSVVAPSRKRTVPVGVPSKAKTVTVNVTKAP
jgi:hypothetical protein